MVSDGIGVALQMLGVRGWRGRCRKPWKVGTRRKLAGCIDADSKYPSTCVEREDRQGRERPRSLRKPPLLVMMARDDEGDEDDGSAPRMAPKKS